MFRKRNFLLISGVFASVFITGAYCSTPFSQYGMIQNVQNYSSNPFYNSNSYVQSTPKIVYANGPTLKPGDCERAVQNVIENICAQRNLCKNTQLMDIRPEAMVALSKLPGYNYSSSCAGYIDTIYETYVKQHKNTTKLTGATKFPATTGTKNTLNKSQNLPDWQVEYNERANELKELQAQNTPQTNSVVATDFPKTFDDLSFSERYEIKRQGYEPYKDAKPYVPLNDAKPYVPLNVERDEKTSGGNRGNNTNSQVYNCIKGYGDAERTAETEWTTAKNNNDPALSTKYTAMQKAWSAALLSPCTCTNDINLQKKMGMYDVCSKSTQQKQQWLNQKLQQYKTSMGA